MTTLRQFLIALQFLTRLPVRFHNTPTPVEAGRSLLCYPLVGLLIGLVLAATAGALAGAPRCCSPPGCCSPARCISMASPTAPTPESAVMVIATRHCKS